MGSLGISHGHLRGPLIEQCSDIVGDVVWWEDSILLSQFAATDARPIQHDAVGEAMTTVRVDILSGFAGRAPSIAEECAVVVCLMVVDRLAASSHLESVGHIVVLCHHGWRLKLGRLGNC